MRHWLFKSEPAEWSWGDQVARGAAGEEWTGVRNYQARNAMREMRLGDRGFFYHSQTDKAVVGIVEVSAEIHPDSRSDDPRWECVNIRALRPFLRPVTLAEIRAVPELQSMALIRNARLSVQPVTAEEWRLVCAMGATEP
jgi:predicted RNA-binding protein with PUA-like domain